MTVSWPERAETDVEMSRANDTTNFFTRVSHQLHSATTPDDMGALTRFAVSDYLIPEIS
jgi:hypothetical protein